MPKSFSLLLSRAGISFPEHTRWAGIVTLGLLFPLNLVLVARLCAAGYSPALIQEMAQAIMHTPISDAQLWLAINGAILGAYLFIFWRFWIALVHIMQAVRSAAQQLERAPGKHLTVRSRTGILNELVALSRLVEEQSRHRAELKRELEMARQVVAQYRAQEQLWLHSTAREIGTQHASVLSYAHYLDEHIQRRQHDPQLRYDFDDVCESSFNLRLISGAMELLRQGNGPQREPVSLAGLMQKTMLALAPSLDRRVMKLTTAEVDESVMAISDAGILSHVLWMMLLSMIRYAADESTLRMRCLYDHDRKRALLSIVVSELAAGNLSPDERQAHLLRQNQQESPHMFAETITHHGNVQLAELLLNRLDAAITVMPLSPYACELCLSLPAS